MTTSIQQTIRGIVQTGLSQSEIARMTNIPQSRVSKWANGQATKSAEDVLVLQRLLVSRRKSKAR